MEGLALALPGRWAGRMGSKWKKGCIVGSRVERRSKGWEVVGWERGGGLRGNISAKGLENS